MDGAVMIRAGNYQVMLKTSVLNALALGAIGPLLIIFVEGLSGSIGSFATAIGLFGLADGIASYGTGRLSDRFGRKMFIVLGGFVQSASFVCYTFVDSLFQLYVLQVVLGVNAAVLYTARDAFMGDITEMETRGRQLGNLDAATGIVAALATIAVGQLVERIGFEVVFYLVAAALFVSNMFRLRFLREKDIRCEKASHS